MKKNRTGFSLVELIVVMAIMAVLVLIAAPRFFNYTNEAKTKHIVADVKTANNKVAVFMAQNKDELPADSTEITIGTVLSYKDGENLFGISGLVDTINERQTYYILPPAFIAKETGSKLKGTFIASNGGNVYYINDGGSSITEPSPAILCSESTNPDDMQVTILYSNNTTKQEYKIDGGNWIQADIQTTVKNILPFVLPVYAEQKDYSLKLIVSNSSVVYARATYSSGKIHETKLNLKKPVINFSVTENPDMLSANIVSTEGTHVEYRINNGSWTEYTEEISVNVNSTLDIRVYDSNGNIIAYDNVDEPGVGESDPSAPTATPSPIPSPTSVPVLKPTAVIDMVPNSGITTKTVITWDYTNSIAYNGANIVDAEWQNMNTSYAEGKYTVQLRVQDSNGQWSDWVSKTFDVIQTPLISWNPSDKAASITLSNGNMTAVGSGHSYVRATNGVSSGKWYFEVTVNSIGSAIGVGVGSSAVPLSGFQDTNAAYLYDNYGNANIVKNGTTLDSVSSIVRSGNVIGIALDMDNGTEDIYINGIKFGSTVTGIKSFISTAYPIIDACSSTLTANFGAKPFIYSIPSGYLPYEPSPGSQRPTAVISMSPNTSLTTDTHFTWGYNLSSAYYGATIVNVEWQNKQETYATGTYTVKLRVQDSNGLWSDWVNKTINILSANSITWNPLDKAAGITLSNGNMTAAGSGHSYVRATNGVSSGKWYFEVTVNSFGSAIGVGIGSPAVPLSGYQSANISYLYDNLGDAYVVKNNSKVNATSTMVKSGSIIGVAFDMDNGTEDIYINGVKFGATVTGIKSFMTTAYPIIDACNSTMTANFGAKPFVYAIPSGYSSYQ